jgi:DNA polymerase-3 subunit alpha (Gram-positive type)
MNQPDPVSSFDLINNLSFCVFDLETTGGNHKSDKIIEIGLVKVKNLEIIEEKNYLIQPEIKIPDFIQKLTSITPKDVKSSPVIEDVIDEVLEFMGDSILVAHNTSFDIPFFNSVLKRLNKPELTNKSLCTNLMTRYLIPHLMNSNLNYMSRIFDISHDQAHRALDDAKATAELLLIYLNIFIDKGIQKINHLYYPRNRYELDRAHFKKGHPVEDIQHKLSKIKTPFLWSAKGENGIILHALPCSNTENEKEYLLEKLKSLDWETLTIRLMGPYVEALVHFNSLFNKLDVSHKSEVIDFLWNEHLPGQRPNKQSPDQQIDPNSSNSIVEKELGDFFISYHLVPDQFIIYPTAAMGPKTMLVFRYPGHQKKMLQFINSKSSKIKTGKLKRPHFHPQLKEFIDHYLKDDHEKQKSVFLFSKGFAQKQPQDLLKELEDFIKRHPNPCHFPKDYI